MNDGAQVHIEDRRVSKLIDWVWGCFGVGIISAIVYVGSQLGGLRDAVSNTNLQVALSRQQTTEIIEEVKDHKERLRSDELDIRDIKTRMGVNMRGGPEVPHGR